MWCAAARQFGDRRARQRGRFTVRSPQEIAPSAKRGTDALHTAHATRGASTRCAGVNTALACEAPSEALLARWQFGACVSDDDRFFLRSAVSPMNAGRRSPTIEKLQRKTPRAERGAFLSCFSFRLVFSSAFRYFSRHLACASKTIPPIGILSPSGETKSSIRVLGQPEYHLFSY